MALIETVVLERTDWPIVEWLTADWADLEERVVIEVPTRRDDFFELCWTANKIYKRQIQPHIEGSIGYVCQIISCQVTSCQVETVKSYILSQVTFGLVNIIY